MRRAQEKICTLLQQTLCLSRLLQLFFPIFYDSYSSSLFFIIPSSSTWKEKTTQRYTLNSMHYSNVVVQYVGFNLLQQLTCRAQTQQTTAATTTTGSFQLHIARMRAHLFARFESTADASSFNFVKGLSMIALLAVLS